MMTTRPAPARAASPASGNAFVYILIACVLLGALTYSLSRSYNTGGAAKDLDDTRASIAADLILAYAGNAANVITQLDQTGVGDDEIVFTIPSDATFNNAPTTEKLFHPDGGGLNYKPLPKDAIDQALTGTPIAGYYIGRFNNFEWTPTTAFDVVFTAWGLNQATCAALNKKVLGTTTITADQNSSRLKRSLIDDVHHGLGQVDMTVALCASCEDKPAMCQKTASAPDIYVFYSILVAR